MKLYSLLSEDLILLNLKAATLQDAIGELLAPHAERLGPLGPEGVREILLERERKLSTTIVEGVCLPHARVDGLRDFLLLLGASPAGISTAPGGADVVHLIFIILTPLTKNTLMLQTLAAVARLLSSAKTRQAMINVKSPAKILKIIEESGVDVKKTLCANDIMNPIEAAAGPETPLSEALETLLESPDEGIPVLDGEGKFLGELAASEIISMGLPKYMNLMDNPSMLGNVEPFEQFFKSERFLKVSDLLRKETMTVELDTPVVQIAYQMLDGKRRRAYVLRDGKLVGVIFRKDIVTKVLML